MKRSPAGRCRKAVALVAYYGVARFLPQQARPGGEFGRRIREVCCQALFAEAGDRLIVDPMVDFGRGRHVRLGNNSGLGKGSVILGPFVVGDDVMIGPELMVLTTTHHYDDGQGRVWDRGVEGFAPVVVGDGTWIGARVTLLPGVKLGRWCVIGAGAVVTRDIPDYGVAVGVPARVVRYWNDDNH